MPTPVKVTNQSPLLQQHAACIYCHSDVAINDRVMLCDVCQSPHHIDCWQANSNRCATFGCAGAETAVARPRVPFQPQRQRRNVPRRERQRSQRRGIPWWVILIVIWGCSRLDDLRFDPQPVYQPPIATLIALPTPLPTVQPDESMALTSPLMSAATGALIGEFVTIEPPGVPVVSPTTTLGLVALDESNNIVRGADIAGSLENPIRTTTNDLGEFVFTFVAPGKYALLVDPDGEAERVILYPTGDNVITVYAGQITSVETLIVRPTIPTPSIESSG